MERIFDEIARSLGLESFAQLEEQVAEHKALQRAKRARRKKAKPRPCA